MVDLKDGDEKDIKRFFCNSVLYGNLDWEMSCLTCLFI